MPIININKYSNKHTQHACNENYLPYTLLYVQYLHGVHNMTSSKLWFWCGANFYCHYRHIVITVCGDPISGEHLHA